MTDGIFAVFGGFSLGFAIIYLMSRDYFKSFALLTLSLLFFVLMVFESQKEKSRIKEEKE